MENKMIQKLVINSVCLLLLIVLIWTKSSVLVFSIFLTSIIITNSFLILKALFVKKE